MIREFNARRRLLASAAFILLMLGGGRWWAARPRIDPRLIGTWADPPHPSYRHPEPMILTFRDDGSADVSIFDPKALEYEQTSGFRWEVRKGFLYITTGSEIGAATDVIRLADQHRMRVTGQHVMGEYVLGFRLLEVTDDMLRVESSPFGLEFEDVWTRVPEARVQTAPQVINETR